VEPLEVPRREADLSRVSGIQGGTPFLGGGSDPQGLRGILEIRAPGLFLSSPDLLFGIFLEVIGHL
jgi:hypothetical protein